MYRTALVAALALSILAGISGAEEPGAQAGCGGGKGLTCGPIPDCGVDHPQLGPVIPPANCVLGGVWMNPRGGMHPEFMWLPIRRPAPPILPLSPRIIRLGARLQFR